MLAACGIAEVEVVRKPKVGGALDRRRAGGAGRRARPARVYDSNGAIIAAAVTEAGGEPVAIRRLSRRRGRARACRCARRSQTCDIVVLLSGGTSKGAGDLSHRIVSKLGAPGILVHGVALKPGKPLCLAVIDGKPLAVLPGFPTSAIFTFHAFVAPVIRARAGLPPEAARTIEADVPVRIASEARPTGIRPGRAGRGRGRPVAFPTAEGLRLGHELLPGRRISGNRRARRPRSMPARARRVTLIGQTAALPDLVIMGSHCIALDARARRAGRAGLAARAPSRSAAWAAWPPPNAANAILRRCTSSIPRAGSTTRICCVEGLALVKGWQRMQGFVHRPDDARFAGRAPPAALKAALADRTCLMVNRNAGAGTRVLIDRLLARRAAGRLQQPAALAQRRRGRRWRRAAPIGGSRSRSVARLYGLGFLPIAPEDYDFLLVESRRDRPGGAGLPRARCAIEACATASARSACALRTA